MGKLRLREARQHCHRVRHELNDFIREKPHRLPSALSNGSGSPGCLRIEADRQDLRAGTGAKGPVFAQRPSSLCSIVNPDDPLIGTERASQDGHRRLAMRLTAAASLDAPATSSSQAVALKRRHNSNHVRRSYPTREDLAVEGCRPATEASSTRDAAWSHHPMRARHIVARSQRYSR
jgi:hypothetical protein